MFPLSFFLSTLCFICQPRLAKKGGWLQNQFQTLFLGWEAIWIIELKTWARPQLLIGSNSYSRDKKKTDTEKLRQKQI